MCRFRGVIPDENVPVPGAWTRGAYKLFFMRGEAVKYIEKVDKNRVPRRIQRRNRANNRHRSNNLHCSHRLYRPRSNSPGDSGCNPRCNPSGNARSHSRSDRNARLDAPLRIRPRIIRRPMRGLPN